MTSSAVTSQPFAIVREKHLSENIWIKKPKDGHLPEIFGELSTANELHVNRLVTGTICGGEQKYEIRDTDGRLVFKAFEESSCCCVHCCGPARSYKIKLCDLFGTELLEFDRPASCSDSGLCCCGCALVRMRVTESGSGVVIGNIRQSCSFLREKFQVTGVADDEKTTLIGPVITCRCFSNMTFKVVDDKNSDAGEIWKRWKSASSGSANEDHENFGVTFASPTSDVMKVLLLASAFLLNHSFFEMS